MRASPLLAVLLLASTAPAAWAAAIEGASRVDAVSVHPDGALVTRLVEVELPKGGSTVLMRGLPAVVETDSIRIEGQSEASLTIISHDVVDAGEPAALSAKSARLKALREERDAAQARLDAHQAKKSMIERYAQASADRTSNQGGLDVGRWKEAWDAVEEAMSKVNEEVRIARARVAGLEADIQALEGPGRFVPMAPGHGAAPAPIQNIAVAIDAEVAARAVLRVTYRVPGARWGALYDARLTTGGKDTKPSLDIVRRASISQTTGEDWADVRLTVSTTNLRRATQAPEVQSARILPRPSPLPRGPALPTVQGKAAPTVEMRSALSTADDMRVRDATEQGGSAIPTVALTTLPAARESAAVVEANGTAVSFVVPERVSVSGDGALRAVRLGSKAVEPELRAEVAPRQDTTAYLSAGFLWSDEAPLFAGEVLLERDGAPVGRGRIPLVRPGERHTLGFGADDLVKVSRSVPKNAEGEAGLLGGSRNRVTESLTTVRNLHPRALQVRVVDRIPVSEDAEVSVEPLATNTKPSERDLDGRRGVLAWRFDLAAGAEEQVRLGYRIVWPSGRPLDVEH